MKRVSLFLFFISHLLFGQQAWQVDASSLGMQPRKAHIGVKAYSRPSGMLTIEKCYGNRLTLQESLTIKLLNERGEEEKFMLHPSLFYPMNWRYGILQLRPSGRASFVKMLLRD